MGVEKSKKFSIFYHSQRVAWKESFIEDFFFLMEENNTTDPQK